MNVKRSLSASVAWREYLWTAVDVAIFLDIARLAGANRPFFSTDLEPVAVLEPVTLLELLVEIGLCNLSHGFQID